MWVCPKCNERIFDSFKVCWHCGTDARGVENPDFLVDPDVEETSESLEKVTDTSPACQSPLRTGFLFVFLTSLFIAFFRQMPDVASITLKGTVWANIAGLFAGLFVTYILRIPNDGSLSWNTDTNSVD